MTGGNLGDLTVTDNDSIINGTPSVSGKTLTFAFADEAGNVGKTATVAIPVTSTNYSDYTITATLTVSNKEAPVLTVQNITKTYDGTAVTAAAISGTATFLAVLYDCPQENP